MSVIGLRAVGAWRDARVDAVRMRIDSVRKAVATFRQVCRYLSVASSIAAFTFALAYLWTVGVPGLLQLVGTAGTDRGTVTAAVVRMPGPVRPIRLRASGTIPCMDGTSSHARRQSGACSHHGGIRR